MDTKFSLTDVLAFRRTFDLYYEHLFKFRNLAYIKNSTDPAVFGDPDWDSIAEDLDTAEISTLEMLDFAHDALGAINPMTASDALLEAIQAMWREEDTKGESGCAKRKLL